VADNSLLCFKSLGENGIWKCTRIENGQDIALPPSQLSLIPLYRDSPPFDIISYTLCHVIPPEDAEQAQLREKHLSACREMLNCCQSSPRSATLLNCLEAIDEVVADIRSSLKKLHPRNNDSGNAIIKLLQGNKADQIILDAANDGDFQIALGCYFRYCSAVRTATAKALLPAYASDMEKLLKKLGDQLRTSYSSQEAACRLRVSTFQAAVPDAAGPWRNSAPATIKLMETMTVASNQAFWITLATSENADFPRWGNAMLSLFKLLTSERLEPQVMARFDQALKRYTDKYQK